MNVAFRRLSKKESVTKLKALGELRDLVPTRPKDVIAGCLPFWAYVYPKLCLENDPRVREAAHNTFGEVVKVLRKGIVSHLPVLMTPLWCGMVDPVLSVSRSAEATFQLAFPHTKRNEVRSGARPRSLLCNLSDVCSRMVAYAFVS